MYTFVKAKLKKYGKNQQWKDVDISTMTLKDIYGNYKDGHIELNNPDISINPLFVDLAILKQSNIKFFNLVFDTWLASLVNTPLPFLASEPVYEEKTVRYADAWQARYSIKKCKRNLPLVNNGNDLIDLCITKENVDYDLLHNRVLTTVNGFFHPNYGVDNFLLIKDGGLCKTKGGENNVGLVSFAHICDVNQIPITNDMLIALGNTVPFKQAVIVVTGVSLIDKSVMVSIGGYLHTADKIVDVINAQEGIIKLNTEYLSLARRIFEMKDYLDISSLQLTTNKDKPDTLAISDFHSNDFIRRLLTLTQSFIIVVDTPYLTKDLISVTNPNIPKFYEYAKEPVFPLLTPTGRLNDYWVSKQDSRYVMSVSNNFYKRFTYETTDWEQERIINRRVEPGNILYANGFLMKLTASFKT